MSTASYPSIPHLILTEEQARTVLGAQGTVELRSSMGERLGFVNLIEEKDFDGWSVEDIAVAKSRAALKRPGKTTAEVLDQLRSLERS